MSRIYLKGKEKLNKAFLEKVEELGADYIEENYAVIKCPYIYGKGGKRIAIAITKVGYIRLGIIDEDCDNFRPTFEFYKGSDSYKLNICSEEVEWLVNTFAKIRKVGDIKSCKKYKK